MNSDTFDTQYALPTQKSYTKYDIYIHVLEEIPYSLVALAVLAF